MAKLYGNENVPFPTIRALREAGHDVLASLEAGRANQRIPDNEVLAYANAERRVVLTNNRKDFRRLHATGDPHCGIVEFKNDADFVALAMRIDLALKDGKAVGRFYASVTQAGHSFRYRESGKPRH